MPDELQEELAEMGFDAGDEVELVIEADSYWCEPNVRLKVAGAEIPLSEQSLLALRNDGAIELMLMDRKFYGQ